MYFAEFSFAFNFLPNTENYFIYHEIVFDSF